jgi:hypothetical protein
MTVATNCLTLCHFSSELDFAEPFSVRPKVNHLSETWIVIEFHLAVAVVEVAVGAWVTLFPAFHGEGCLALAPHRNESTTTRLTL